MQRILPARDVTPERRPKKRFLVATLLVVAGFFLGLAAKPIASRTILKQSPAQRTWVDQAFSAPLPSAPLLTAPTSLERLDETLAELLLPPEWALRPPPITIIGPTRHDDINEVRFTISDRALSSWAYTRKGPDNTKCAVLLIPGSGSNQSSAMQSARGYHGNIVTTLAKSCDVHSLIKPNEDARAIHDGKHKLNDSFVHAHLLNHGGSYGARYLVEAYGYLRWLRDTHHSVGVVGLSQGGYASFLSALVTQPDFLVAASGFSIEYQRLFGPAGYDDIIIPGMLDYWTPERIQISMRTSPTHFFLSYGKQENGIYGHEARTGDTCSWLQAFRPDTTCVIHSGGHAFPEPQVSAFVASQARL